MAGLGLDALGGGQFTAAIKAITEAERKPIQNVQGRKAHEEARLKLFQEFKGKFGGLGKALDELTNFRKFRDLKAELGDGTNIASVTVDNERAEPGVYEITVDQLAKRSSIITNGFKDPTDAKLGIGFIVARMPDGEDVEVFIDEDHASIQGIANVINKFPNSPIQASAIKDLSDPDRPWRLVITSKKDGYDDNLILPEIYFMDGDEDIYIDDKHDADNALIQLDGFEIEAESNDITDFVQGVNLHLKQARPDQPFTLTIKEDYQKISGKIKDLVEQVNSILEFINKQNQIDEKSNTKGTFAGDTGLQTIEYRLRNLLHEGFPATIPGTDDYKIVFLHDLGVEFEKNGLLKFKEEKFTKNMETDFDTMAEAITGPFGLGNQLKKVIQSYTQVGSGLLNLREQGLRARIKKYDQDIEAMERRVEKKTQQVTDQFAKLQTSLNQMKQQQAYLSATLPSGGLIGQLMGGG